MKPPWKNAAAAASWLFMVWAVMAGPQLSAKEKPRGDPILGERIAEGVVLEGRLWLRGAMASEEDLSGGLISLSNANDLREVHFKQGVLDIEKAGHELWVLRSVSPTTREFVVSAWKKGVFEDSAAFTTSDEDKPIALLNAAGTPTVLSRRTIRALSTDNQWHTVSLQGELRSGVQITATIPAAGGSIYVGFNMGEWGGGLQRVNLQTGVVVNVERRDTQELCASPLNSDCDPVTGVIPDPQGKECILASVGLVHLFSSEGRILRVCGDNVTPISEKPVQTDPNDEREMTEAFYGLVAAEGGTYWGITWRALYRFGPDGPREYDMPKLKRVSGIYLSRDLIGVIVVRTDVNWAVSTSGYTPLIVPTEE